MKKTLLSILAFIGFIALHAQVQKTPMIEHFTQASCAPCAGQNPILKNTLDIFGEDNYVRISHQTSWPGVDPMNAQFPTGPGARVSYYNFNGVPATSLNGGPTDFPNTIVTSATLTNAASQMTPYSITATQTWISPNEITVNIDVANVTDSAISSADKIYVSMVENEVTYPSAPGSNGETSFEYVMRQMYNASTGNANATTGAPLGTIAANSSTNFNFTITSLPSYLRDKREVSFAIYIQNNATKVIHQAAKTEKSDITTIPGAFLVTASSASAADPGFCDYSLTPGIEFTNNDDSTIVTEVVAQYSINGGTPIQQTFNGSLDNGQSTLIAFPIITLNGGTNTINSEIISVNGTDNWVSQALMDMSNNVYQKLNMTAVPAPLLEGMENATLPANSGYTRNLASALFDADASITQDLFGIVDGPTFNVGQIGGFGTSNRSLLFRFYAVASGEMNLIFHKLNLGTSSTLTFNHAYRQYQNENDRLAVQVSTDCGATWSTVFDQGGSTLATLAASTDQFIPTGGSAAGWSNNTIDLSAFDESEDVIIRFKGTSAYGNNLWLDDINLNSTLSVEDYSPLMAVKLYPNPTSDFIQISGLTSSENYSLYNMLGAKLSQGTVSNDDMINVRHLTNGMYFLTFNNGQTIKFTKI
ncbi:T9SS-dependent choice-of-anchor J family protein [Winogradskyella bathintestinalis]|uniref:T9SS type A sorting domain-containing protein n=1 Tax=Winogradskyella bathintestinalis TaxID=3035208 RepID=A0ABT7ZVB9_9FLAO|nr:T9SS type A sorting domain-containing protein [Winogradskyella bathintestinalis]MDN3492948.1 T9SS type A sorting domain-containing protein [Winogradskyella bathintestinalis]